MGRVGSHAAGRRGESLRRGGSFRRPEVGKEQTIPESRQRSVTRPPWPEARLARCPLRRAPHDPRSARGPRGPSSQHRGPGIEGLLQSMPTGWLLADLLLSGVVERCDDFSGGFGEELADIGTACGKEGGHEEVSVGGDAVAMTVGHLLNDPMRAEDTEIPARLCGGTSLVLL